MPTEVGRRMSQPHEVFLGWAIENSETAKFSACLNFLGETHTQLSSDIQKSLLCKKGAPVAGNSRINNIM